ncbi:hypothetical protein PRIPAC_97441 [Pristionchus pacificus]|uniref:Uncharacterized protein n=1 Tax=Pristionchus pacificus TaxID=54126 RepID=A0A2A6BDN1_PRIPA|nr:hypothetical protein PRIPAC_97441 [Pristionchus pacificus]|eukprot:PDM63956.1 hypothetical protein PRIPAC_49457 [Pristionchus pacificus]
MIIIDLRQVAMCTPFSMHWYMSSTRDLNFNCFGCNRFWKYNCFSLACTNKPEVHKFCHYCAMHHDLKMDFSCPACLLRDEVDKCKKDAADRFTKDAVLLTVANFRENGITSRRAVDQMVKILNDEEEDMKEYVFVNYDDVQGHK